MKRYEDIIFIQNPEPGSPVAEWLENAWQGDDDSLVDCLAQYDEPGENSIVDGEPWGSSDDTFRHRGYIVSYNRRLGYVGLCREYKESRSCACHGPI